MGKKMYEAWNWAEEKGKSILNPFDGGGFASGLLNVAITPISFIFALPFFGLSALLRHGFKREYQVVIPLYSPEAFADPTLIGGTLKDEHVRFVVDPAEGTYTFLEAMQHPTIESDLWCDPSNLRIASKNVDWIHTEWDDRRGALVYYFLMMTGEVPTLDGVTLKRLPDLVGHVPPGIIDRLSQRPRSFEYWKNKKFDLKVPPAWQG